MIRKELEWDKIIIGIDPGTNVMGYGLLGVKAPVLSALKFFCISPA